MEDNFRNSLIIISAVIIGAIFVHGLWTIRKNKNPYKLKASKDKVKPLKRNFDHGGFDQDGVGKPKVKPFDTDSSGNELSSTQILPENQDILESPNTTGFLDGSSKKEPVISSLDTASLEYPSSEIPSFDALEKTMEEISTGDIDLTNEKLTADELSSDELVTDEIIKKDSIVLEEVILQKPIYPQPVSRPKPQSSILSKAELKRNQIEINFGNEIEKDKLPSVSAIDEIEPVQSSIQPEVLALSVVVSANQIMPGATLLPMLLTLGLKYGEMNIFHRHQDNAGTGPVTFSIANMMNPGSFDLDSMETFVTQGVTLFMMLPNAGNAFDVYQQMLSAAKQLGDEFNAQVLDDKRNVMNKQTEQHYVSRIRDFEIKNRSSVN